MAYTANQYDKGDKPRIVATFISAAGALVDPGAVTVKVKDPDLATTTPTATKDSVGTYYIDLDLTKVGVWYYRFEGTGTNQAAIEQSLVVRATQF